MPLRCFCFKESIKNRLIWFVLHNAQYIDEQAKSHVKHNCGDATNYMIIRDDICLLLILVISKIEYK